MRSVLLFGALLCSACGESGFSKHVQIESDCSEEIVTININALRPEDHPPAIRFSLRNNGTPSMDDFCSITYKIVAPEQQRILFTMESFNLENRSSKGLCIFNYLQAAMSRNVTKRFCGSFESWEDKFVFLSDSNIINMEYLHMNKSSTSELILNFTIAAVHVHENDTGVWECPESQSSYTKEVFHKCANNYCVPIDLRCDGYRNCPDGDDELDCPSDYETTTSQSNTTSPINNNNNGNNDKPPTPNSGGKKVWIFALAGGLLVVVIVSGVIFGIYKHRKNREFSTVSTTIPQSEQPRNEEEGFMSEKEQEEQKLDLTEKPDEAVV